MRIPEQFDDPSDVTVPDYRPVPSYATDHQAVPSGTPLPIHVPNGAPDLDSTSLRPHIFTSDEWPPQTRFSQLGPGPFLALGLVVGMATALPVTAWAVRTHRWPSLASVERASAASVSSRVAAPAAPAPSPVLDPAPAAPSPTVDAPAASSRAFAGDHVVANEKIRKKRTVPGRHATPRANAERSVATGDAHRSRAEDRPVGGDSASPAEDRPSTESKDVPAKSAPERPSTRSVPGAPVEDQAAAELSTSLK
jgi:hypothetical protein